MIHKNKVLAILLSFLPSLEQAFTKIIGNYFFGLLLRIILLIGTPVLFILFSTKNSHFFQSLKKGFIVQEKYKRETMLFCIIGPIITVLVLVLVFFLINPFLDHSLIRKSLMELYSVTIPVYILIGLCISLINPFLEEYFWRGFIFDLYNKEGGGYWTGILFSLHHVVMLAGWFSNAWQLLSISCGLALVGVLFNYIYHRTQSLYATWIIHMSADLTIIIIGFFILF